MFGGCAFSVVDVETTGLFPRAYDRIVEIAVVRLGPTGEPEEEFVTLVNPERDVGPTRIHDLAHGRLHRRLPVRVHGAPDAGPVRRRGGLEEGDEIGLVHAATIERAQQSIAGGTLGRCGFLGGKNPCGGLLSSSHSLGQSVRGAVDGA